MGILPILAGVALPRTAPITTQNSGPRPGLAPGPLCSSPPANDTSTARGEGVRIEIPYLIHVYTEAFYSPGDANTIETPRRHFPDVSRRPITHPDPFVRVSFRRESSDAHH
jgi:hypothetical protein